MTYTFLTITGQNLEEIYAVKIGATNYSLVGPYLSTGDFIKSVTGTTDTFFTKISGNIISILTPPIHRNGEIIKLISNDRILELTDTVFANATPVITGVFSNPERIGNSIKILGRDFLGAQTVIFGNDAAVFDFKVIPDGKTIVDCVVPEDAGSGFLKVVNFNNITGTSLFPFYPFPRIDTTSESTVTGVIGGSVNIIGKSFNHVTGVRFNSVLAESFTIDSNFKITATVPSGAVNGRIAVSGHSGTFSFSNYDFEAIPLITGQSPLTGERKKATTLLMTGAIPEILFASKTGEPTGYAVLFRGENASGTFFLKDGNLTGIVPAKAKKGIVSIFKNKFGETYRSDYIFNISGIVPSNLKVIGNIRAANTGVTGTSPRLNFKITADDLFDITGVSLHHLESNKIYNLPTGNPGFSIELKEQDIESEIYFRGLTGKFFERTSSTTSNLTEGAHNIILIEGSKTEYTYSGSSGSFYLASPVSIGGFGPLSAHLGQKISVTGTGLYAKTIVSYHCHATGTGAFSKIALAEGTQFKNFAGNRSGFFNIPKTSDIKLQIFPSYGDGPQPLGISKEFVTGFLTFKNTFYNNIGNGNHDKIVPFTVFSPPFISGVSPNIGRVGDTVTVSGYGFKDVTDLKLQGPSPTKLSFPISTFTIENTKIAKFTISQSVFDGAAKGFNQVEIINPGGESLSRGTILLKDALPIGSGFTPQPAREGDPVIFTGFNLKNVSVLAFTGTDNPIVTLSKNPRGPLDRSNFVTGFEVGTGIFLKFLSPFDVKSDEFVTLVTSDGDVVTSLTKFRNEFPTIFTISGLSGLANSFTGMLGDVFGITGSGFTSASAKIFLGTENTNDFLFKQAANQQIVNNNFIKATIEPGMNGALQVSGFKDGDSQISNLVENLILIPQISGVKSKNLTEGDTFVVTGINNFNFSGAFTGDINLREAPQIKLAITGVRYGSTNGEVEYINYNVSGFRKVNSDLEFSGMVNSEFAGTGRLFLIHPNDLFSLGDGTIEYDSRYIYNNEFFKNGLTKNFLPRILNTFDQTVTINEKKSTLSGFSPSVAQLEAIVNISGTSLRAVTGVALFSGSTVSSSSIPFNYECLYNYSERRDELTDENIYDYPINYGSIKFTVPADYALSSGRIRLFSKNFTTDSDKFLKIFKTPNANSISPTGGVAGDLITLNGSSFNNITGVKFVDLDGESASGIFSIIDDTKINVIVPNEGRLPAPQIVSIIINNEFAGFNIGQFEVRQGSEKFLGNIVVTENISGANFLGSGAGGRPTVNGSGVLLVGEATLGTTLGTILGAGPIISITGGLDTDSASQIFTGDGSKKLFGLNSGIHTGIKGSTQQIRSSSVLVSIDGLMQNPVEHYTIIDPLGGTNYSGLQFTSIPISGADIEVRRFGDTVTVDITGNGISKKQSIIYALVLG